MNAIADAKVTPATRVFKEIPSQAELNELLEYRDGELYWKKRPVESFPCIRVANTFNSNFAGKKAGGFAWMEKAKIWNPIIRIKGEIYYTHRIVWTILNGFIPNGLEIDHINGNRRDNRIENLRLATRSENMRNRNGHSKLGLPKGVVICRGKIHAKIGLHKKDYFLGSFKTIEEASNAYNEAAKRLHGEFARSGSLV